jgi:lipopolysaccharide export LptBFGC system permease protein LptF
MAPVLPLLVFIVTLMAVPLSRVNPRQGRFLKLLPAILLYMAYLTILIAARGALEKGKIPPRWACGGYMGSSCSSAWGCFTGNPALEDGALPQRWRWPVVKLDRYIGSSVLAILAVLGIILGLASLFAFIDEMGDVSDTYTLPMC